MNDKKQKADASGQDESTTKVLNDAGTARARIPRKVLSAVKAKAGDRLLFTPAQRRPGGSKAFFITRATARVKSGLLQTVMDDGGTPRARVHGEVLTTLGALPGDTLEFKADGNSVRLALAK